MIICIVILHLHNLYVQLHLRGSGDRVGKSHVGKPAITCLIVYIVLSIGSF